MLFDPLSFLDGFSGAGRPASENLFSEKRKAVFGDSRPEPRCDFAPDRYTLGSRGFLFLALWRRSLYGRTLTDIKSDADMVPFFADHMSRFVARLFGESLAGAGWCLVAPPPRRHLEGNFAHAVARDMAARLDITFEGGVAHARSRQRIGAEFDLLTLPPERNVLLFDDIITTGSTLSAMLRLLAPRGFNVIPVVGINNKA